MTAQATPEVLHEPIRSGRERAQALMDAIENGASYMAQWSGYESLGWKANADGALSVGLVEYAADENSTKSLLWRSFALETGLRSIRDVALYGERELSSKEQGIYDQARRIIPAFFEKGVVTEFDGEELPNPNQNRSYHWFFNRLAKQEGIDSGVIMADPQDFGYDPTTVADNIPIATGMFLNRMMRAETYHDIAALPGGLANDMLRVALNFQGDEYAEAIADSPSRIGEFARLARFAERAGYEHDAPTEFLYNSGEQGLEYARTLNSLYDSLATLPDVFPDESGEGVVRGARFLAAGALFAVANHIRQGEVTDISLQLLGGAEVPDELTGRQPLGLLQWLDDILRRGHAIMVDPETDLSRPVREPKFDIYNYDNPRDPLRVMKYIRPEGGHDCNYRFEYGGRRSGVQASIGITFDEEPALDPMRPFHKKSLSSNSISIRLDREGRNPGKAVAMSEQDPTQEIGTLSLDVGSIMGKGLGGQIGRLLAWGNVLRSEAVKAPQFDLNHATSTLDQTLGTASGFRQMAHNEIARLERRIGRRDYRRPSVLADSVVLVTS